MIAPMKSLLVIFAILGAVVAMPARAEAKGLLIYNSGDETFATGPLPAPYDTDPQLAGFQAGYLCKVKGVFWSYYSVSECKPVAFQGDKYVDGPELTQALNAKYSEADMQRGIWGHFGWMLLVLGAVAGLLIWLKEVITGKGDDDEDDAKAPTDAS
jgi:hypothetical protein